ncbi:sensor histidine kinase [Arcobacter caeni]|uniref:sensor histidine kinase n=1 Tax=Arcobacter caeni TaxID=1912877 RepID=UPI0010571336|nr:HAMP domain-containing sensor histidine kinase [Arcobacter caeni]
MLLKNLYDNHTKNQEITFYKIQKETNILLTKVLYKYSNQKEVLLRKHKEVLDYLGKNSYNDSLDEISKIINKDEKNNSFNIYITDENLVIKNTTYKPDINFDLSFAKDLFEQHKKANIIGISPPVFEMYSLKFFSYTDSFLAKTDKRILQVSYTYNELEEDLKKLQDLLNSNQDIKSSNAYVVFNDGYVGDFIFKSLKSYKPTLDDITARINKGKELSSNINEDEYITNYFKKDNIEYKVSYLAEKSPIFDEAKVIFSIVFDEDEFNNNIFKLNLAILLISVIGIITIFIIYKVRYEENLLKYKDKFIEHSVHEIKTPLSIINLNVQLRNKTSGEDKYSKKIEGALKTLENSYEDMTFLHTKNKIDYVIENLNLEDILKNRIKYFNVIATTQNRQLELIINKNIFFNISKIELHRLIDNNLSNAIKYSKVGSNIKIVLSNNILEFHSFGNPIRNTKNIFKRYVRENENARGHGLGLAIIKDICKKYKIKIDVKYENNQNIFSYIFICHTNDTK